MATRSQFGLSQLDAAPLHEKVYREIVRALMSGEFEPGQKLTSRKLAQELGTSDMPVRSALLRLQSLRALRPLPNGSMEVPLMTSAAFVNLMDARTVLEGAAAERAAGHINGNNLRTIRRNCAERMDAIKAGDIGAYLRANYDFKFAIYRHCGNEEMIFLIETLWMQVGPFLRNMADWFKGDLAELMAIDHHAEALAALEAKDGPRAREAIEKDIREGEMYLLKSARFHDSPAETAARRAS